MNSKRILSVELMNLVNILRGGSDHLSLCYMSGSLILKLSSLMGLALSCFTGLSPKLMYMRYDR
jgi:hypothetical protein